MKQLPNKWKEHIRKMVEYNKKAEKLRQELEQYLISYGFSDDRTVTGCEFEDAIIDTNQSGDWENLIVMIEDAMNGILDNKLNKIVEERIKENRTKETQSNNTDINIGINGWLSPEGKFYNCNQENFDEYYKVLSFIVKEYKYDTLVDEDILYDNGWISFIHSYKNMQDFVFFKPIGNMSLNVTPQQVQYINSIYNNLTDNQKEMVNVIIEDYT
jgi:hypothetical protein